MRYRHCQFRYTEYLVTRLRQLATRIVPDFYVGDCGTSVGRESPFATYASQSAEAESMRSFVRPSGRSACTVTFCSVRLYAHGRPTESIESVEYALQIFVRR